MEILEGFSKVSLASCFSKFSKFELSFGIGGILFYILVSYMERGELKFKDSFFKLRRKRCFVKSEL